MRNSSLSSNKNQPDYRLTATLTRKPPSRPTTPGKSIPADIQAQCYVVEKILDMKGEGDSAHFLIKWAGYDESESTWEPRAHLIACEDALKEFNERKAESARRKLASTRQKSYLP